MEHAVRIIACIHLRGPADCEIQARTWALASQCPAVRGWKRIEAAAESLKGSCVHLDLCMRETKERRRLVEVGRFAAVGARFEKCIRVLTLTSAISSESARYLCLAVVLAQMVALVPGQMWTHPASVHAYRF